MFQTQKNGWDGPVLGVKQATENKRQFDDEVSIFSHLPFPVIFMWRSKLTLNSCWCLRYWKLARAWLACNMEPTRVPPRYSVILKMHTELTIFGETSIFFDRGITFIFFQAGMTPYGASRQIRPEGLPLHSLLTSFYQLFLLNLSMIKLNYRQHQL